MHPETDSIAELQAQVRRLEQRVAALEGRKPKRKGLELQLGVHLVNRAGAITLALGILFFFKYAVDSRWIGPAGRVALGVAAGLLLVGFAERLRKRAQQAFAQGVAACGIAILYTAFYASFAYYDLLPYAFAFCGMFAACVLSSYLSFRYRNPALAVAGAAGAIFAPVFLGHAFVHPWLFFSYLLLLDLGMVATALRCRWMPLYALVFGATAFVFAAWACGPNAQVDTGAGLLFLCVFFALFFAVPFRFAACAFLPLNAVWAFFSAWMLLDRNHPGWFVMFGLALAAVHFFAAGRQNWARNWLYVLGHACLVTAGLREVNLWVVAHSAPLDRSSVMNASASVLLAMYAFAAIVLGILRRAALYRTIGLTLLAAVVGKLYCYDVWQLTRVYRISAFVVLGILLLAASYLYSRFRGKLGPVE
jgi:uncharacterized membrane protein